MHDWSLSATFVYSSEGLAGAKVELARAESRALETISEAIQADGCSQTEYMIGQRYMDMFRTMVTQASKKVRRLLTIGWAGRPQLTVSPQVIYLPYEVSGMRGIIASLPSVFGVASDRRERAPAVHVRVLVRVMFVLG